MEAGGGVPCQEQHPHRIHPVMRDLTPPPPTTHAHRVRKGLWWVPEAVNVPTMATGALGGGCQEPPHPESLCELGTLP